MPPDPTPEPHDPHAAYREQVVAAENAAANAALQKHFMDRSVGFALENRAQANRIAELENELDWERSMKEDDEPAEADPVEVEQGGGGA